MSAFRLETVTTRLGYDCSSLSPSAHALERSIEFKRAAAAHVDQVFDPWRQDRSFTSPYAGRLRPGTTLQPDAHGDLDPQQVLDLAPEHRANRSGVPPTFDADLEKLRAMRASLFVSWVV